MTPMSVVFFSLRLLLCITICVVIKHRTQYVNVSVCSCKLQELAEALCQCWETIETSYTDNCKKVFLVMRLERDQIIRYFYDVRWTTNQPSPLTYWPLTYTPADLLTCWPVNLLTYTPFDLLTCWPADLLTCWPVDLLTCSPVDMLTCWPVDLLTCSPVDLLTCWYADLLTCRPAHLLTCWHADLLTCRPAHLLICWPADL